MLPPPAGRWGSAPGKRVQPPDDIAETGKGLDFADRRTVPWCASRTVNIIGGGNPSRWGLNLVQLQK